MVILGFKIIILSPDFILFSSIVLLISIRFPFDKNWRFFFLYSGYLSYNLFNTKLKISVFLQERSKGTFPPLEENLISILESPNFVLKIFILDFKLFNSFNSELFNDSTGFLTLGLKSAINSRKDLQLYYNACIANYFCILNSIPLRLILLLNSTLHLYLLHIYYNQFYFFLIFQYKFLLLCIKNKLNLSIKILINK